MEVNEFQIFSSWEPRAETPKQLGQRTLQTLDALSKISPLFSNWWFMDLVTPALEKDWENPETYLFPLSEVRGRMTEIVEDGVRRGDYREPEPAGGYSVIAFNGIGASAQKVSFNAHGGGIVDPRAGRRNAEFKTGGAYPPDPTITSYPIFKAVLETIVSAWDVGYAQAYSTDLRKFWNKPQKFFLDLAWMTYLSPTLAAQFTPPAGVPVERMDNGGLLLIATEETFDVSNVGHMAAAESITDELALINAEKEKEWARLWPTRRPS
ncbi:MAG TPA: Imm52 family immunity protein [Rhizomicrobium sp.]|nr:Imm52 family immunity protein [Rhizomicrobium sp.]